jgi:hypothetical protein
LKPDTLDQLTLATLPKHFRQIALWFVITLTVGYTAGLVFVMHTTSLSPKGVEERYRGNQGDTSAVQAAAPMGAETPSANSGVLSDTVPTNTGVLSDTVPTNTGVLSDTVPTARGALPSDTAATQAAGNAAPPNEPEMKFEKSLPEMLNITHTHILAMTSFLVLTAAIFALSSRASGRMKSFLIVEPFVAILTSFVAMWLMRYVHPAFSYLLMLSSGSFGICFYVMMGYSFIELVSRRKESL